MILPYRGLGSGIKQALDAWLEIDFIDDRDGCLFTATVRRNANTSSRKMNALPGGLEKTSGKILAALVENVNLTIPELASLIGVAERPILKPAGVHRNHLPASGPSLSILARLSVHSFNFAFHATSLQNG